ncbi:hypothetical protein [Desulfovibrio piger]|uniref:hypothetical protein n=1 Tax=Desulfovibrio piger TaxID=901 RepID=UPI0026EED2D0|nr:hypothetical protein [Desulfovibrio piger]
MHADSTAVGTVGGIVCIVVLVAAEGAVSDGQRGTLSLALDGDRSPTGGTGGTGTVQRDGIVFKGGARDSQSLSITQIGGHGTDDGIVAVNSEGIAREGDTFDLHIFIGVHGHAGHAGGSIVASRHTAVEGGAFRFNRDQGLGGSEFPLLKSHIAGRSTWINIDDAGIVATSIQRAARQRYRSLVVEDACSRDLVDGDFNAFIDIDIAIFKDQVVEGGILLVSSIFNCCGRPSCSVFDFQRHFGNVKLRRITGRVIPGNKRVTVPIGISAAQRDIDICINFRPGGGTIIVEIDIAVHLYGMGTA